MGLSFFRTIETASRPSFGLRLTSFWFCPLIPVAVVGFKSIEPIPFFHFLFLAKLDIEQMVNEILLLLLLLLLSYCDPSGFN